MHLLFYASFLSSFFFCIIHFCSIYMAEIHFKFLLNFSVSYYYSFESVSAGSLFVLSWYSLFFQVTPIYSPCSLDHVSVYLLTLASFLLVFFLFLCSFKSFMLSTFWTFLHRRKSSLVKYPVNNGHVHSAAPYSFSFLHRDVFQSKHKSYISTLFSPAFCIESSLKWCSPTDVVMTFLVVSSTCS